MREEFRNPEVRRVVDYLERVQGELRDELVRVDVVETLDDLPEHAPPTRWFRVMAPAAARANVYVGNGPNRPLSFFTTTPMS